MYSCNSIHPKYTVLINVSNKCSRTAFNSPSSLYNRREESIHLEPILRFIAALTQDHYSPWKKCNLFVPKIDSSANRNVEM